MKIYSAQLIVMAGMLGELIVRGVTNWFYFFAILFLIIGVHNGIEELKSALKEIAQNDK